VQLAVGERGVVIYNRAGTSMLSSYKYEDISTFGGCSDTTFMLVVSSSLASPDQPKANSKAKKNSIAQRTVEKLTYAMHKLKVSKGQKSRCWRMHVQVETAGIKVIRAFEITRRCL